MATRSSSRDASSQVFDAREAAAAIAALYPQERPLPLHEPKLTSEDQRIVADCVASQWVSARGDYVDELETTLARWCGTGHAVAVVNGTAALHAALILAGIGPGDEVFIPALTFVATANAVSMAGAVPHLLDSEPTTLGLNPAALDARLDAVAEKSDGVWRNKETGRRLAAIVPMHVFGHPVDMASLLAVAEQWGLPVIEDAAEGLGSTYHGQPVGSFGRIGTLSFNGNKLVTTGGGGALLIDDPDLAEAAHHLTTTAKRPHRWAYDHDKVGFNYRLPNLNAALGCSQMRRLAPMLEAKRRLARHLIEGISEIPAVTAITEPPGSTSNYWLNAVLVPDRSARDGLLESLHDLQLLARPAWALMHKLKMYADVPKAPLPCAEWLEDRIVCLPSSPHLAPPPSAV